MNLKPINKTILIEEIEEDKVTKSGIIVKEKRNIKNFKKGKVLITANDVVKVGDIVLFNAYGPNRVNVEHPALWVAKDFDILAICE